MGSRRLRPALWLPALLLIGCYNPSIQDGTLGCGPGSTCPDGFVCQNSLCFSSSASVGDGGTTSGDGGGAMMCYGPIAACTTQSSGRCDPVCQTGCGCKERCTFEQTGVTCKAQTGTFVNVGGICRADMDQCRPGSICVLEATPACAAHCYRFCRSTSDCPGGARCEEQLLKDDRTPSGLMICSPPFVACNPWGRAACGSADRPSPAFGCYVVAANPNETVCECAGTIPEGGACNGEHQCAPGFECAVTAATTMACLRVCSLANLTMGPCPTGQLCTTYKGSTRFGVCR
jgi:hypothetical protein